MSQRDTGFLSGKAIKLFFYPTDKWRISTVFGTTFIHLVAVSVDYQHGDAEITHNTA